MGKDAKMVEKREPGPNKRDNMVSTGLSPDTFQDFEEYRAENNLTSKSEAANRLFRSGLMVERINGHVIRRHRYPLYLAFVLVAYITPPPQEPVNLLIWAVVIALLSIAAIGEIRQYRK